MSCSMKPGRSIPPGWHAPAICASGGRDRVHVRRSGYILLETVLATGLLLVGLAVIGAQLQEANKSVRVMDLRLRAMMLAEQHLAELDLGLVKLDSLDQIVEEDFGPRYPNWAWRLTIEPSRIENMFVLRLDVFHRVNEGYKKDGFDYDSADLLYTVYAMRPSPQPLNLIVDFGLSDTQAEQIGTQFGQFNLDPSDLLPSDIPNRPVEELIPLLASLLKATGMSADDILALLPPEVRTALEQLGGIEGILGQGGEGNPAQVPEGEEIPDE